MKNQTIEYYKTSNYGAEALYCNNQEERETITRLTGKKTLTTGTMECLKKLGFNFKQVLN